MSNLRIVFIVVDTRQITLYKETGEQITIPQGDPRIRGILDFAIPQITEKGYADICLSDVQNVYSSIEEKTENKIKFFSIAKKFINKLISGNEENTPIAPMRIGELPAPIEEILKNAESVSSSTFTESNIRKQSRLDQADSTSDEEDVSTHTIIAVVENNVIPNMEKLKTYMIQASRLGSVKGVENFLTRVAKVINDRRHSIEDLLTFMEKGDLPIADDGSILVYKVLNKENEYFVDCHTHKVQQKVGSYVFMDEQLVNANRHIECASGLHIARRGYLSSFGGDVCVLCKLNPEDVIAVPHNDPRKLRACGYHIIFQLSDSQHRLLNCNRPITDTEDGKLLLADAISGNHIGITEHVKIGAVQGGKLKITRITEKKPVVTDRLAKVESLDTVKDGMFAEPINPKQINKELKTLSKSYKEQIAELLKKDLCNSVAKEIIAIKKKSKKGWNTLGVTQPMGIQITDTAK